MLLIAVLLNVCLIFVNIIVYLSNENRNLSSFFAGCGAGVAFLGVVFGAIKLFN